MKRKYIFLWGEYTNLKTGNKYNYPVCGSSGLIPCDGRESINTLSERAQIACKHRKCIGYSIGYLTCHDPENKHAQSMKNSQK